ncbi:Arc family DNA-binding protein [Hafnia alvei]|uniref:Arc family DNA-binding protein n=1 Tax=Hafnia alvei TaxID=569 RepID=UPI004045F276
MTDKENPTFVERFTVRMPDGLRDAIAERAKKHGRSMNSEIIQVLQDALDPTKKDESYAFVEEWKSIYFDNPDIAPEEDAELKNTKIDTIIAELSSRITGYANRIEALIKMRRNPNKKNK